MDMNRKRSQLQSYFAGIFDGEGHVAIRRTSDNSYVCQIVMQMNDPQAVLLVWREYPDCHVRAVKNASGTIGYAIQFSQHKAYTFLQELLPFVIVKHEQVQIALSFLSHRRRDHQEHRLCGVDCLRCAKYTASLLRIRAEIKQVNSVNALLQHELREYRAKPEDVEQDVAAMSAKVTTILEGLETRLSRSTGNKTISACEQDIVQHPAA